MLGPDPGGRGRNVGNVPAWAIHRDGFRWFERYRRVSIAAALVNRALVSFTPNRREGHAAPRSPHPAAGINTCGRVGLDHQPGLHGIRPRRATASSDSLRLAGDA